MKWKWGSGTSRQFWTSLNKTVHDEAHLSGWSNSRWVSSAQSSHKLPSVCHAACSCCHLLHIGLPRSALSSHSFIDVMKFLDVYIDKFREIPTFMIADNYTCGDKQFCSISCWYFVLFCLYLQLSLTQWLENKISIHYVLHISIQTLYSIWLIYNSVTSLLELELAELV